MEVSDLPIWRKLALPASSRSKAVDSPAAHRFQTGRCNGCVFPVSDKPDRFYYYEICHILPDRLDYYNLLVSLADEGRILPHNQLTVWIMFVRVFR